MAKGYVLHEGPSPFDGQPIVSIATLHSSNRKTGDMVQIRRKVEAGELD